jgi:hypothetical protein
MSIKSMIIAIHLCILQTNLAFAGEWLCDPLGGKKISVWPDRIYVSDHEDPTPVKLSEVSENGARYSDRYNNLYMKNISYHEDDGFLEFMAQKTNRREDGSISVIWNLDFSALKPEKEGALVIRSQAGGVSTHYDLAAFKCYALQ